MRSTRTLPTTAIYAATALAFVLGAGLGVAHPRNSRARRGSGTSGAQTRSDAGNSLADSVVAAHARVRARVGVPPMRWSDEIASVARDWAQQLCRRSEGGRVVLEHRPEHRYGENLHWQGGSGPPPTIDDAVTAWENERRFFNPRTGRCRGGECRHYTQLVWRDTTEVGCGTASCGDSHFWVCNYAPPGNWVGRRPY